VKAVADNAIKATRWFHWDPKYLAQHISKFYITSKIISQQFLSTQRVILLNMFRINSKCINKYLITLSAKGGMVKLSSKFC